MEPRPMAIFDRSAALDRLGGDEHLLREIAGLFLTEYPPMIDAIRSALHNGDAQSLERTAHALKGSVANFDASAAVKAALHLELIARSGDLVDAGAALSQLEVVFAELRPILEEVSLE